MFLHNSRHLLVVMPFQHVVICFALLCVVGVGASNQFRTSSLDSLPHGQAHRKLANDPSWMNIVYYSDSGCTTPVIKGQISMSTPFDMCAPTLQGTSVYFSYDSNTDVITQSSYTNNMCTPPSSDQLYPANVQIPCAAQSDGTYALTTFDSQYLVPNPDAALVKAYTTSNGCTNSDGKL